MFLCMYRVIVSRIQGNSLRVAEDHQTTGRKVQTNYENMLRGCGGLNVTLVYGLYTRIVRIVHILVSMTTATK